MQQEAPDELVGRERHRAKPLPAVAAVVLVAEGHAALVEAEQAAVRDGDAVGVAGEIGEHRLGSGEGRLGVDEPVLLPQRREIGGKGRPVAQAAELAEECQPARHMGVGDPGQEEPPEQAREYPHRQKETGSARHPADAIGRYSTAWHDHVEMRMVRHRRAPGVEHGGDADPGAEMLGIGGDGEQRLGRRAEQQVVDHRLF